MRHFGTHSNSTVIFRLIEWPVIAVLLLLTFALFYRFGPNLSDREWHWSTPGAVIALVLWMARRFWCASTLSYFTLTSAFTRG